MIIPTEPIGSIPSAEDILIAPLGTTDDGGFAPFLDDASASRELAFAKIRARVRGTLLAAEVIGGG